MLPEKRLSVSEINKLSFEEFVAIFGKTIEHCALGAAVVYGCRPFSSFEDIRGRFEEFMNQLHPTGKAGVIRLHPDLAGKLALSGGLTSESKREQASAGLDGLTPEENHRMTVLNDKYKKKFDFPFVICVCENKKDAIMKGLEQRLNNSVDVEIENGMKEVIKICSLRLQDLVLDSDSSESKL